MGVTVAGPVLGEIEKVLGTLRDWLLLLLVA